MLRYEFLQFGDFIDVDSANSEIFPDTFRSTGWTPSAHVFGGVDVQGLQTALSQRRRRAIFGRAATPDRDFIDFDSIDLAGFKATVGVHYMF